MGGVSESYHQHVEQIEKELPRYAKRSFEVDTPVFVDGESIHDYFEAEWSSSIGNVKLRNRTPLQLERDRILYSLGLRKQTEKFHVLFSGQQRIARNYTTHTMRMAHVTRAICRGLSLNADFAEAVALGSKTGATSFIHAGKKAVHEWVLTKLTDEHNRAKATSMPASAKPELDMGDDFHEHVALDVKRFLPWVNSRRCRRAYSSGIESYWLLCTDPFSREDRQKHFVPETMYGIWRHSLEEVHGKKSFQYEAQVDKAKSGLHQIDWKHCTYEAVVVQYADDITWVLENLNDANSASLLSEGGQGLYRPLNDSLRRGETCSIELLEALNNHDAGALYGYFIADFVDNSSGILKKCATREGLLEGREECRIGLSPEAGRVLSVMKDFLANSVFDEPRVRNRKQMLESVVTSCLEFLYISQDVLQKFVQDRKRLEGWDPQRTKKALDLILNPIHRVQLAVDILAQMGDEEVFNFVGMNTL